MKEWEVKETSEFWPTRAHQLAHQHGWMVSDHVEIPWPMGGQLNLRWLKFFGEGWVDTANRYLSFAAFGRVYGWIRILLFSVLAEVLQKRQEAAHVIW